MKRAGKAIAMAVSTAAALGVGFWRSSTTVRRFGYNIAPLSSAAYVALASGGGWTTRTMEADGFVLRGIRRKPAVPNSDWVIFFNGNDAHPLDTGKRFCEALRGANDWGCEVWAYRGYDGSGGEPNPEALENDASNQYARLLSAESVAPSSVHVVGFSLGSVMATSVAARAEAPPASLTLLSPTTELDMLPKRWFLSHRYETLSFLDAVRSPVLVVHGSRDDILPVEQGRTVAARLGSRATLVEEPGLGHLDVPVSSDVLARTRSFIEQH